MSSQPPENDNNNKIDWNAQAEHYSSNITRFTSLHATDLIGALYSDIVKAKTILEIGCGPGAFGVAYASIFPQGIPGQTLICSDLSPGMVQKCRAVMEATVKEDFATTLEYQVLDGATLEGVDDDIVDIVVSVFGVFVIPDRAKTLATIQRVLRKEGGVFGTTAWSSVKCQTLLEQESYGTSFHDAIETSLQSLTNLFSEKEAPWKAWLEPEKVETMLQEASFPNVRVHRSIHTVVWPSGEDLWTMIAGSPMSKVKTATPEAAAAAKEKMLAKVAPKDGAVFVWTASNVVVAKRR